MQISDISSIFDDGTTSVSAPDGVTRPGSPLDLDYRISSVIDRMDDV